MSRSRTLTLEQYPCQTFSPGAVLHREGLFVRFALSTPHHKRKISMPASVRRLSLERTLSAPEPSSHTTESSLIWHHSYTIQVNTTRPSVYNDRRLQILSLSACKLTLWLTYFLFRWSNLESGMPSSQSSMAVYLVEIFLSARDILLALNLVIPLLSSAASLERPSYRLLGSRAPTVDICVTCCGEPMDVILNTVNAAIAQDYPTHNMRIMVLDDGHDDDLRRQIEMMSTQSMLRNGPRLLYRSRQSGPGHTSHYKSGNLQYGLEEFRKLGPSEFFANLDCDMVPVKFWLRAMLPHLILDDQLSLINPPQNYYNIPPQDPFGQQTDLDVFFSIYEPLNDRFGAARCMGTGFVLRRRALDSIGGWPLVNVGEDFMVSSCLSNAGWKTAYIGEKLQYGLAPDSLSAHIKQKQRWVDGAIEVHRRFGFYTAFVKTEFSRKQRLIFILQTLREFTPLFTAIGLMTLPYAWASSVNVSLASNSRHWQCCVAYTAMLLLGRCIDSIMLRHIGMEELGNLQASDIWMAPYAAIRCLRSVFPCFFSKLHFSPSGSVTPRISERTLGLERIWTQVYLNKFVIFHLALAGYIASPLVLTGSMVLTGSPMGPWLAVPGPLILLCTCSYQAAVPALYMLNPPKIADWKGLTYEDEDGVRRPRDRESAGQTSPYPRRTAWNGLQWIEMLVLLASFIAVAGAA